MKSDVDAKIFDMRGCVVRRSPGSRYSSDKTHVNTRTLQDATPDMHNFEIELHEFSMGSPTQKHELPMMCAPRDRY